ncbi:hypothetical protein RB195_018697 [Necator americanus]|uniref:Endonuclease/exonuclease/phosphatase domain-containing protein n=1 Tax=Necator americanus TaxID=51031 RepID=A0ABR1CCT1_NECAM
MIKTIGALSIRLRGIDAIAGAGALTLFTFERLGKIPPSFLNGDGVPVPPLPGSAHNTTVSRTSVRPNASSQVTGRCKGGGLESPPTNELQSTPGNRKESPDSGGKPGTVPQGRTGLHESYMLPKRKRTRMTICTYNARTLASEAAIEDLMMQAKKIKYDVIGLTETR